jgi:hypothetical protein
MKYFCIKFSINIDCLNPECDCFLQSYGKLISANQMPQHILSRYSKQIVCPNTCPYGVRPTPRQKGGDTWRFRIYTLSTKAASDKITNTAQYAYVVY